MERQKERVRAMRPRKRIVFPEGTDPRVIEAAKRLAAENLVDPILIGPSPQEAISGVQFVDPAQSPKLQEYTRMYYDRRRSKGITLMEASQVAQIGRASCRERG